MKDNKNGAYLTYATAVISIGLTAHTLKYVHPFYVFVCSQSQPITPWLRENVFVIFSAYEAPFFIIRPSRCVAVFGVLTG